VLSKFAQPGKVFLPCLRHLLPNRRVYPRISTLVHVIEVPVNVDDRRHPDLYVQLARYLRHFHAELKPDLSAVKVAAKSVDGILMKMLSSRGDQ